MSQHLETKTQHKSEGKPKVNLVPPDWVIMLAEVLESACRPGPNGEPPKYGVNNWFEHGDADAADFEASLYRHFLQHQSGELFDKSPPDGSGLLHITHVAIDALFLATWLRRGMGQNWQKTFAIKPEHNLPTWDYVPKKDDEIWLPPTT